MGDRFFTICSEGYWLAGIGQVWPPAPLLHTEGQCEHIKPISLMKRSTPIEKVMQTDRSHDRMLFVQRHLEPLTTLHLTAISLRVAAPQFSKQLRLADKGCGIICCS
jgi:hypothetical protein